MGVLKKFSSQMDEEVFNQLKALSHETHQDISELLNEAVIDLVNKKGFRPDFKRVAAEIMDQYDEALQELAK